MRRRAYNLLCFATLIMLILIFTLPHIVLAQGSIVTISCTNNYLNITIAVPKNLNQTYVLVSIMKVRNTSLELYKLYVTILRGGNNETILTYLPSGTYKVFVNFWNDLLRNLESRRCSWITYYHYEYEVVIG